jgi:aryl-alcohol dehydrogenase-like predicted oxidoreductase
MTMRRLGRSELEVGSFGFGMWRMSGADDEAADRLVRTALEVGATLFDTADIYGLGTPAGFGGAEAQLGRLLARDPSLRARLVLATKGGIDPGVPYDSSADYLVRACEASLVRLRTDVIDLYQIHRPDLLAHPAEVAGAFEKLHHAGKIRAVGVSNFSASATEALLRHLTLPLATLQPEFSPRATAPLENGILDLALREGLAVLAWSPLGGGRLLGDGADAREARVIAALDTIARARGASRAAVALAFVRSHPAMPIPLLGTQSPERLAALVRETPERLERREWYAILEAERGAPMP